MEYIVLFDEGQSRYRMTVSSLIMPREAVMEVSGRVGVAVVVGVGAAVADLIIVVVAGS
jgi:hypothetical protein